MDSAVGNVLNDCQRTTAAHRRGVMQLHKLRASKGQQDAFLASFLQATNRVLKVYRREPAVERIASLLTDFVGSESSSQDTEDTPAGSASNLLNDFLRHLIKFSNAKDKAPRLRVCQLVAGVMDKLGDDAEIDDDLFDALRAALIARLSDKVPSVRVEGIKAVHRLQDPTNADDEVVQGFLRLMSTDSSADVRSTVLSTICITRTTLPFILERTRDVKESVRCATFKAITEKVELRQLSIEQRVKLLKDGLNDRAPEVRDACVNLLSIWLRSVDYDTVELLESIDVIGNEQLATKALSSLFSAIKEALEHAVDEHVREGLRHATTFEAPISATALSAEAALFWRMRAKWLQDAKLVDELDELLPDVIEFCSLLKELVRSDEEEEEDDENSEEVAWFVRKQLFCLARFLDVADEAGRRDLNQLLLEMLTNLTTDDDIVEPILKVLSSLHTDEAAYIRTVVELINDVQDPLDAEGSERAAALGTIRGDMEHLKNQLRQCDPAGGDVAELEAKLQELRVAETTVVGTVHNDDDLRRWLRALSMAKCLFQYTTKSLDTPELATTLHETVLPAVSSTNPLVRHGGFICLGLCCLMDKTLVAPHAPLLLKALGCDLPDIQVVTAKALGDMLAVFPRSAFDAATCDSGEQASSLFAAAVDAVTRPLASDDAPEHLRLTCVEAVSKLFLVNKLSSPTVITTMLNSYLAPDAEEPELEGEGADDEEAWEAAMVAHQCKSRAKQCQAVFWPAFAAAHPAHQASIMQAIPSVVQELLRPVADNRCKPTAAEVKPTLQHITRGLEFLAFLLSELADDTATNWHNDFAVTLVVEAAANPHAPSVRAVCKTAASLQSDFSGEQRAVMRALVTECKDAVKDKPTLRVLDKLITSLAPEDGVTVDSEDAACADAIDAARKKVAARREDL